MMKFVFGMQIPIKVFHMLLLSFWLFVARHAHKFEIRNLLIFAISPEKRGR